MPIIANNRQDLDQLIQQHIHQHGPHCNLNHIDVSNITDMSFLFSKGKFGHFQGDISQWNVSNVRTMWCMFMGSEFQGDISKWDTSKANDMAKMFTQSKFNGDISNWNVTSVRDFRYMFSDCPFEGDLREWVIQPKALLTCMVDARTNALLPTVLDHRIMDLFPTAKDQNTYLNAHILPLSLLHVRRALDMKNKPAYLSRDVFDKIKELQATAAHLGVSGNALVETIYHNITSMQMDDVSENIDFSSTP